MSQSDSVSSPPALEKAGKTKSPRTPKASAPPAEQQFLKLMSHEMRTPLNGVIGMLGLLSRTRLDGAQRAYAEAAQKSAEHLLGLVNDLLDYARLEAGALEFDYTTVNPETLTRSVAELLSTRAHERGIEIVWSIDPHVPHFIADEGRLRQVLFNLAGNAVKFTEVGGVHIQVKCLSDDGQKAKIQLIVDDSGPGVPLTARKRIFEEFGHVDHSDAVRHDGAGLGLAVVKRLATNMGGQVLVTDRPDATGARFVFTATFDRAETPEPYLGLQDLCVSLSTPSEFIKRSVATQITANGGKLVEDADIRLIDHALAENNERVPRPETGQSIILLKPSERDLLPAYRSDGYQGYLIKPLRPESLVERIRLVSPTLSMSGPAHIQTVDDRLVEGNFKGVRVLLVEDNPVGQLLAKTILRREGCLVQTAADGHEAIEAVKSHLFDIIFMDMRMPRMDGVTAAQTIREQGLTTPIVALTANAYHEDRIACLAAGMDDHLTKPLELNSLRSALSRWTNNFNRAKVGTTNRD